MAPPDVNEVLNTIKLLNLHKSVGPGNIEPYFLRLAGSILSPNFMQFYGQCFSIRNIPKELQNGKNCFFVQCQGFLQDLLQYFENNTLPSQTFHYTRCITPKRVTSLRCSSPRHNAEAT